MCLGCCLCFGFGLTRRLPGVGVLQGFAVFFELTGCFGWVVGRRVVLVRLCLNLAWSFECLVGCVWCNYVWVLVCLMGLFDFGWCVFFVIFGCCGLFWVGVGLFRRGGLVLVDLVFLFGFDCVVLGGGFD